MGKLPILHRAPSHHAPRQRPHCAVGRMGNLPILTQRQYNPPEDNVPKVAFFGTDLVDPSDVVTVST